MVSVLMGDEHPVQLLHPLPDALQLLPDAPGTDAGIYQKLLAIQFNKRGISLAATGQHSHLHIISSLL